MSTELQRKWWKEEVIYQIYPRSFMDSNGDGIGDLRGIISKLDHLHELGVDIIWLSPIYDSPNDDNGYDIRNYREIHQEFGTMSDFEELLEEVHARGMKLIMDLVVNHSSDEHEWFVEAKKSKDNKYRDYYHWKKGVDGGPPNNWPSFFGGSAWEYDEASDEYYLHLFTKKQPDLNWENPKVREEVKGLLKFWLDKGIDGFRMDVIPLISKRLNFENHTLGSFNEVVEKVYSNGPKVHDYLNEIYEDVLSKYDIMTVGEGPGINKNVGLKYVGHDRGELNMIFHLDHMFLGHGPKGKFDPIPYDWCDIKKIFRDWHEAMGESGWLSIFLDNHDFPRLVSRFGNDNQYRRESAKLLAMLVLTQKGTACLYQGSEIGMSNVVFDSISEYRDVETHNFHKEFIANGVSEADFLSEVHAHGRDNARTPFQWDESENAGFSSGKTWINVNPNYKEINLAVDKTAKDSIFKFYKNLLSFRKENLCLVYGQWVEHMLENKNIYAYDRIDENTHFRIVLNHSNEVQDLSLSVDGYELIMNNIEDSSGDQLSPWEARLYKKSNS